MEVFDHQGKRIYLGQAVGRGGEATVYRLKDRPGWLAKVYIPGPRSNYPAKLDWMLEHPPENPTRAQKHPSLAWPAGLFYDTPQRRRLAGYLMPHIQGAVPLLEVFNPRRRAETLPQFNRRYLHRTARNLASALDALHRCGYVAGDLNESNVLVTPSALITLIDTDSFQVLEQRNGRPVIHPCPVGKLEYTPPELQGKNLERVYRKPEHDAFSLAVLIFQLLMEGNHPYRAQWLGSGDPPPVETRIAMGAFPYCAAPPVPVKPPKNAPDFNALHPAVTELFRRCFIDGQRDPAQRPGPSAWEQALAQAEGALVRCGEGHIFSNHLAGCPACPPAARRAEDRPHPAAASHAPEPQQRTARQAAPPPRAQPAKTRPQPPAWQTRVQGWAQTQPAGGLGSAQAPRPQPSPASGSQPGVGASQPRASISGQPAASASSPTFTPRAAPVYGRRRYPLQRKGLRERILKSCAIGGGSGALAGALIGILVNWIAWSAGSTAPWVLLWALGGAAGGMLRGTYGGRRLGLLIAQYVGWKRFWQVAGLFIGALLGGMGGLIFIWAIFPVFIGLASGARLGLAAGNRIWQTGNRLGWERVWTITSGFLAALLGAGIASLAGASLPGMLIDRLASLIANGLLSTQVDLVWVAVLAGVLGGAGGGAIAGALVDLSARLSRLID